MVSSNTSFGCRCRKCNSPAWPISFRVIKRGRRQKGSIRWDTTWRRGHTLSFRYCNRQLRRRSPSSDAKLGDYIRAHSFTTVVGGVEFGAKGGWAYSRILQVQYRNITGHDIAQFKDMTTQGRRCACGIRIGGGHLPLRKGKAAQPTVKPVE